MGPAILQKVDIEAAIIIEIKESGSRTNGLWHEVTSNGTGIVDKVQPTGFGDVDKPRRILCLFARDGWRRLLAAQSLAGEHDEQTEKALEETRRQGDKETRRLTTCPLS